MLQSYQLNFLETSCIYSYCAKAFNLQAQIFVNANDEKDLRSSLIHLCQWLVFMQTYKENVGISLPCNHTGRLHSRV